MNLDFTGTKYVLEDEAKVIRYFGKKYIHVPVIWEEPTYTYLEDFIFVMEEHLVKMVLVHCEASGFELSGAGSFLHLILSLLPASALLSG